MLSTDAVLVLLNHISLRGKRYLEEILGGKMIPSLSVQHMNRNKSVLHKN